MFLRPFDRSTFFAAGLRPFQPAPRTASYLRSKAWLVVSLHSTFEDILAVRRSRRAFHDPMASCSVNHGALSPPSTDRHSVGIPRRLGLAAQDLEWALLSMLRPPHVVTSFGAAI